MKNISTANKGLKALAKENPALVENKFGYDVPGYMYGGIANFAGGGSSVFGPASLSNPMLAAGPTINLPKNLPGKSIDIDAMDFSVEPLDINYDIDDFDAEKTAYENYMEATRTAEDDARDDLIGFEGSSELFEDVAEGVEEDKDKERKRKMEVMGEMLEMIGASSDFSPLVTRTDY